ncbi:unnamed protein product [Rotaria socialis]|uniref:EF-hand domain-containing protein n=1 Tax=Rotaria socialis TaxID=392032 RepID=A0A818C954_9BILA|nr:unnamed protein product [Rotaria socialis]
MANKIVKPTATELTLQQINLLRANTNFTDYGDQLSFAFDLYDIFDDGLIDQTELYELNGGIHDRTGDHNPKTRAAEIIASLDVSGDKKLCKEEFISGCKSDPYLREIFAPNV